MAHRRRSPLLRVLLPVAAALVLLLAGVWLGGHPGDLPSPLRGAFFESKSTRLTDVVLNRLLSEYYRPLNRSQLVNQGLSGMVASLDDPYSHYFDPHAYAGFMNETNPHVSGIGVDVLPDPHGLRVVDVFPGTPAAQAGLARGDTIVAVGSTSLAGRSADASAALIKGPAGTKVKLTVLRGTSRRVVTVVRRDVVVPVTAERMLAYKHTRIGYVQLTSFTQGSGAQLKAQVHKALAAHVQALVLDLRENGGGLLQEAVNVASIFIPDGTIVSTDGRSQPRQVYTATGGAIAPRIPLVVLVDRGTASAAEIVTGALKDRGRAEVVGTNTYGKGVFQEIEPLPNGGALDITVGEYFTPSGRNLGAGGVKEGKGIPPTVYSAGHPRSATDTQLQAAERTVAVEVR